MKLPHLFSSIATSASAALLASSAYLFAPAASAFTFIDVDEDGYVEGARNVLIGDVEYDVDFVLDTARNVYSDGAFLPPATTFYNKVLGDLLHSSDVLVESVSQEVFADGGRFLLGIQFSDGSGGRIVSFFSSQPRSDVNLGFMNWDQERLYARLRVSEPAEHQSEAIPEPSLIFGFITLGGVMLGSKRKTKG